VLAGVAIALLTLRGRRRQQPVDSVELSAAERQRLQQLLDKTERDS
jgi:hypothetical protein